MFNLFWNAAEKSNGSTLVSNTCCGNRTKGKVKTAFPAPSEPSAPLVVASYPDADSESLPPTTGDLGDHFDRHFSLASDHFDRHLASAGDHFDKHLAVAGELADKHLAAAGALVGFSKSSGNELVEFGNDLHLDGHDMDVLPSYEDRDDLATAAAAQIKTGEESDGSASSDERDFQAVTTSLKESQKQVTGILKAFQSADPDGHAASAGSIVHDLIKDFRDTAKSYHQGDEGTRRGSGVSDTDLGARDSGSRDRITTCASSASGLGSMSVASLGTRSEGKLRRSVTDAELETPAEHAQAGVPKAREDRQDEDEDDDKDNLDDPKLDIDGLSALDRAYMEKFQEGSRTEIERLRQTLAQQGDDEPIDKMVPKKPRAKKRGLTVLFMAHDGKNWDEEEIHFTRKPLGMMWDKKAPLKIDHVKEHSHAEELGVKKGWVIKEIDEVHVQDRKYHDVNQILQRAVKHLPNVEEDDVTGPEDDGQVRSMQVIVKVETARGLGNHTIAKVGDRDDVPHFCIIEIPGKPHSRIQTNSAHFGADVAALGADVTPVDAGQQTGVVDAATANVPLGRGVSVTHDAAVLAFDAHEDLLKKDDEETKDEKTETNDVVSWNETHTLFDFHADDDIEFTVLHTKRNADKSLGRVILHWHTFAAIGFEGRLTLDDIQTGHATRIRLNVKVEVLLVSEKKQAIGTFAKQMRGRMLNMRVPQRDIDASFPEGSEKAYTTASEVVRESLLSYHKNSEALGVFTPFPGRASLDPQPEVTMEANEHRKLRQCIKALDQDDDETRLWINSSDVQQEERNRKPCPGCQSFQVTWHTSHCCEVCLNSKGARHGKKCDKRPVGLKEGDDSPSPSPMRNISSMDPGARLEKGLQLSSFFDDAAGLVIVFEDIAKQEQTLTFTEGPLGIEFAHYMPLVIQSFKPSSVAEKLGVVKGWKIKLIAGQDISKMRYKEASALLFKHVADLPKS